MILSDKAMKESADAFIPPAGEGYERMVEATLSSLGSKAGRRSSPKRAVLRTLSAAAAVLAALVVSTAVVFGARPALASEVPVLNGIVYAVSPTKPASEAETERLEALVAEVFRAFAARDYAAAEACFSEGAMHTRETYLAAAYTDQTLIFGDTLIENAEAGKLEISELSAERKAFRYTGLVTLNFLTRDGSRTISEDCAVRVRENTEGMRIESIEMQSERYLSFANRYEQVLGALPPEGTSFSLIPIAYRCLYFDAADANRPSARGREGFYSYYLSELDGISAPAEDKAPLYALLRARLERARAEITPEMVTAEDIAVELMYRYWLGGRTGKVSDFSDILEHNERTDLFLWDAKIQAEALIPGTYGRLNSVKRGSAEIRCITENPDGTATAWLYVFTEISAGPMRGVGEEIVLTLLPNGTGFTVVGFDREVGDGIYIYTLKPLAEKYRAAGYSWQEAGRMAYEGARAGL